ncbi:uroporphyrinogen-III synthase [soil metagenome]
MRDLPLNGLRVLVTREQASSEEFAARLEQLGATPVICPAIEIRFRNPPGLDEALAELDRFGWLALTSARAVRALASRFDRIGLDPAAALCLTRIAVIGQATLAELERLGGRADIVAGSGNAAGLASDLESTGIAGDLILFPASRIARPELARRLREAGAGVVQLAVYETVPPAQLAVPDPVEFDAATFASPSAVRNVAGVVANDWFLQAPIICVGQTTARAAREAGAPAPIVTGEPSMVGIVAALLEFQQREQQELEQHGAD